MATANKHTEAVKLIVKAPNQLIEDQNIECDLSWTVLHLKEHLSNVYPTQPLISDQKLIYSGQLLTDDAVLKDILRKYEGQKAHSLHLVCAPPRGASDSWRKTVPSQLPHISRQPTPLPTPAPPVQLQVPTAAATPPAPSTSTPVTETPVPSSSTSPNQQDSWAWLHASQQRFMAASSQHPAMVAYSPAAWSAQMYDPTSMAQMQQAYAQYMSQYIGRLQQAGVPAEVLGTLQAQQWAGAYPSANAAPRAQHAANPAAPGVDLNAQNNAPAQPAMMGADDDELRMGRQRDWLDWFYVLSRVLVLFSIVYFYSSLKRFILVSVLGLMLYLYHLGYFRMQQGIAGEAAADNNNQPVAQVPPPAQAEQQQEEPQEAVEEIPAGLADTEGLRHRHPEATTEVPPVVTTPAPPAIEPPSAVTVTWTFLSSFFTSLIPDRPNVV